MYTKSYVEAASAAAVGSIFGAGTILTMWPAHATITARGNVIAAHITGATAFSRCALYAKSAADGSTRRAQSTPDDEGNVVIHLWVPDGDHEAYVLSTADGVNQPIPLGERKQFTLPAAQSSSWQSWIERSWGSMTAVSDCMKLVVTNSVILTPAFMTRYLFAGTQSIADIAA